MIFSIISQLFKILCLHFPEQTIIAFSCVDKIPCNSWRHVLPCLFSACSGSMMLSTSTCWRSLRPAFNCDESVDHSVQLSKSIPFEPSVLVLTWRLLSFVALRQHFPCWCNVNSQASQYRLIFHWHKVLIECSQLGRANDAASETALLHDDVCV